MAYLSHSDYGRSNPGHFIEFDNDPHGLSISEETQNVYRPAASRPAYSSVSRRQTGDIHPRVSGVAMGAGRREWDTDISMYGRGGRPSHEGMHAGGPLSAEPTQDLSNRTLMFIIVVLLVVMWSMLFQMHGMMRDIVMLHIHAGRVHTSASV